MNSVRHLQVHIMSTDSSNLWTIEDLRAHRHQPNALHLFNIKQHRQYSSHKKKSLTKHTQLHQQSSAHQFQLIRDFIKAMLHLRHRTKDDQDAINAIERSQSPQTIEGETHYHDTCYNNEATVPSTFQATTEVTTRSHHTNSSEGTINPSRLSIINFKR